MCRIAVIILHYENLQDTLECINSLNTQDEKNFDIVVVDNGSKNGKTESVEHLFSDNERIHFLYSKTNLGFAKGNNLGFCYAKEELHSDIIVLANNDLIFSQPDFITKVQKAYIEEGYDVAGPRIISLVDGMNQNPVARMFYSKRDVLKRYLKTLILYALNTFSLDLFFKKIFAKPIQEFQYDSSKDFQLYGACLIFGTEYIKKFNGLYPGTFMYVEEDILRYQVEVNHLKMVYLDEIEVKHKEGSSTETVYEKGRLKRRFFYKWSLNSLKQLIGMIGSQ
ncbi:MAG: glycosyltransferase family 2 protein [Anaerosacchariphilus sp.]